MPLLIVCAGLIFGGPAMAKRGKAPTKAEAGARAAFEDGRRLYKTSQHEQALEKFLLAYKLDPRPAFLFNIARCHEMLGQLGKAIEHYDLYLTRVPEAKNRDLVQARLKALRERQAKQKETTKKPAPTVSKKVPVQEPEAEPAAKRDWRWYGGWAGVGLGAALVITGGVMGALASQKTDEYNEGVKSGMLYGDLSEIESSGETFQAAQIGGLVAGGVVLAAGAALVTWSLLDGGEGEDSAAQGARVGPYFTSRGGGLVLGGSF